MKPGLDVKHINPFLQSTMTIFENAAQIKLALGKPTVTVLDFPDHIFALQVGITGDLKGQVLLVMTIDNAKEVASKMMFGMSVEELDEISTSALSELSNMIMGNTATLFSTQSIHIDITPPMVMLGTQMHITSEAQALKVPLIYEGKELVGLYICVAKE